MNPYLGETITRDIITSAASGAAADADAPPTVSVFEDGTDAPILAALPSTKRGALAGNYRIAIACTAGNGFEAGKSYNVVASATVAGVGPAKSVLASFVLRDAPPPSLMIHSGTAQAGTLAELTLALAASANDYAYKNHLIYIRSGAGASQIARIVGYDGNTKIVAVAPAFLSAPDNTSVYEIWAMLAPANDILAALVAGTSKVTPADIDGETFASLMETVRAVLAGIAVVSGNQVAFKKRDGVTTKITITYGDEDGERAASAVA